MTEHRPIKPPLEERKDEDGSSLLERASGAFGLNNLGAAPMPRSFDDVPMKRARPLRKPDSEGSERAPAPAPAAAGFAGPHPAHAAAPDASSTSTVNVPLPAVHLQGRVGLIG